MKFLAKLLPILLLFATSAAAQVAVTGNLKDITTGNVTTNVQVDFELQNYGSQIPHVISTGTIVQVLKTFKPNTSGIISGSVYQNSLITPLGTFYKVCILIQGTVLRCNNYLINGPFDLNSAIPLNITPVVGPSQLITQTFPCLKLTPSTTWVCVHNFGDFNIDVALWDSLGNKIGGADNVQKTDANTVTITWITPQAGLAVIVHAGSIAIATNQPNAIISNPTGAQTIISQPFTLAAAVDFITNGTGTHNGIENFTNGLTSNSITDSGLTPGNCVQAGIGGLLQTVSVPCPVAGSGVTSLNTLTGAVTIAAGTNVTVTPAGNTLTIASTSGGSVSSVGLSLPPELSVANSPVTSSGILTGAWNDEQPSTFFRGPGTNGIGGIYDGSTKATGNSTSVSLTLTPSASTDWAFFLSQSAFGSQSSPVSMPGPWVNQIQNGNDGAVFSNILSSATPLTGVATFANSATWAGMMLLLQYQPATTPTVVQKRSTSGSFSNGTNISFLSNTTAGNAILVTLVGVPPSANFSTATWTDSQGNIFTPLGQTQNGANEVVIAALASNISGATADVLTLHSTSGPFVSSFMTVYELSNIKSATRTPYFGPLTLADMPSPLNTALQTKVAVPQSTTCPTTTASGATCTYTLSWIPAWTDTLYVPVCNGVNPTNYPNIQGVIKSTNNIVVVVENGTANLAMVSGYSEMGCVGVHP